MKEIIAKKLLSGRFLLTILVGVAFIFGVKNNTLSPESITGIIVLVFTSYFNKKGDKNV